MYATFILEEKLSHGILVLVPSEDEQAGLYVRASGAIFVFSILLSAIIFIVGFDNRFVSGISDLYQVFPDLVTIKTLNKFGYIAGLGILATGVLLTGAFPGIPIVFVSLIFILIGFVGAIMLAYKFRDKLGEKKYTYAGILLISNLAIAVLSGEFFLILNTVAWLLLF